MDCRYAGKLSHGSGAADAGYEVVMREDARWSFADIMLHSRLPSNHTIASLKPANVLFAVRSDASRGLVVLSHNHHHKLRQTVKGTDGDWINCKQELSIRAHSLVVTDGLQPGCTVRVGFRTQRNVCCCLCIPRLSVVLTWAIKASGMCLTSQHASRVVPPFLLQLT